MTDGVGTSRRSRDALVYISDLHGQLAGRLVGLVAAGVAAGVAEALSLLALVRAAIGIASESGSGSGPLLPGMPGQLSPGAALVVSLSCALVAAVLHVLLSGATVRLGERVALAGRNRLIDAFVAAQWSHVARLSAGTFQQALTSFADKSGRAAVQLASALSAGVIALSLAAVAVWVSPLASLLVLVFTVLVYLLVRRQVGSAFQRSDSTIGQELDLAQAASETASLGLEYRAAGVQQQQAERLRSAAAKHASRLTQLRSRTLAVGFLSRDLVMISLISVVSVLYFAFDVDATMAASVLVVVRMLGYLQQAFRASHDGLQELAGAAALRDLIDELERQRQGSGSAVIEEIRTLAVSGVSFSYDGVRRALDDVTIELAVNATVGLVGPSGAGKSTLAEVLLGLRAPETGRVVVNGIDLADVDRAAWARLVAFVPQHQQFATMSVGENIRFLRPWISDADVVDAARRAHVLDEIERLPDGFDHRLASGTGGLSGGQRQRIAIARALAGRPSLLVLDEPTSALDAVTEQRFRQTLDDLHGSVTIVVIAHRPATLAGCDVVISLAGGRTGSVDRMA